MEEKRLKREVLCDILGFSRRTLFRKLKKFSWEVTEHQMCLLEQELGLGRDVLLAKDPIAAFSSALRGEEIRHLILQLREQHQYLLLQKLLPQIKTQEFSYEEQIEFFRSYAVSLAMQGKHLEAIEILESLIDRFEVKTPRLLNLLNFNLASSYGQTNRIRECQKILRNLLKDPVLTEILEAKVFSLLGTSRFYRGNFKSAHILLQKAFQMSPVLKVSQEYWNYIAVCLCYAMSLWHLKKLDETEQFLMSLLEDEVWKQYPYAVGRSYLQLAHVYFDKRDLVQAYKFWKKAEQIFIDKKIVDDVYYEVKARYFASVGEHKEAKEIILLGIQRAQGSRFRQEIFRQIKQDLHRQSGT